LLIKSISSSFKITFGVAMSISLWGGAEAPPIC
jgi:hypothetical protein